MSLPTREVTEWRVVGYDHAQLAISASSFDHMPWTDSRRKIEADLESLRSEEPPFDEIWVEERTVTATEPKRIEWEASNAQNR